MPKKLQLCFVLFLATTLNYLDRQTMSIVAPAVQREMHLDNEALGWLFAVFYYAYTFSQMAVGPVLDRLNLRWAFGAAVLLWSLVSVFTGLAGTFAALLIFRLLLGIVEAANWPAGLRLVARLLEPRERALGNGIFTSGTSVGALLAPGLVLGISAAVGWRWAFVLVGSLGAIWIAGWILITRDRKLGSVWREPPAPGANQFAVQLRAFKSILRSPRFVPVLAVSVLVNPCIYYSVNWLPTYFAQQRGLNPGRQMGWILTGIYLGLDVGNLACGGGILAFTRLGRSIRNARRLVFLIATVSLISCAGVPLLPMTGAVIALVLVNFGIGIWVAMYLTMAQEVSSTHISTSIGLLSGCGSLAGALAMWGVGRITKQTGSFSIPMGAVACAAVLSAIAGWIATKDIESTESVSA
jgi:ACS family hexuronate transporter-like MFS transporter